MRKRAKKSTTSEEAISISELTKLVVELRERVRKLEGVVSGNEPLLFVGEEPSGEPSMGRKPKLPADELVRRRDRLSSWIEQNWPFLSVELGNPRNAKFAAYAFVKAKRRRPALFQPPFYHDPEKYTDQLWEFLHSRRFGGNPRYLAGAMAGLPELSWKRSLDISQEHPLQTPLQPEAWRDHFRRRFNLRFRELESAKTVDDVKTILTRSVTDDITYRHLKKYPQEVLKWVVEIEDPEQ
jgi:hypothetical protein